jgi:thiol-disulfide isomerase/thioredoxin
MAELRGKVALIDFWTYSCINCRRSLPHVEAWYNDYKNDGFVVVGVHSPEFSFEHVVSNVKSAAASLGVDYPIAIDDNLGTWNTYGNEYWPAEYLIDPKGNIRHYDFGEGGYGQTETLIRELLTANGFIHLPPATGVPNLTPDEQLTPESYLGYDRLDNATNADIVQGKPTTYSFPSMLPQDQLAFSGTWDIGSEYATSGANAALRLNFSAKDVYLVLGGSGTVSVYVDGQKTQTLAVGGEPNLYTMVNSPKYEAATLGLDFTSGVHAYDFTFG